MPIFSVVYEGRPTPEAPAAATVGGASIVCWIRAKSNAEAAERARQFFDEQCWIVIELDRPWKRMTQQNVPAESMNRFEQAQIDGECYIFHTWNNFAEDDEPRH